MASSASAKLWLFFVPRIMEIAFYRRAMNRRIESLIRTVWKVKTDSSIDRNGRRKRPMLIRIEKMSGRIQSKDFVGEEYSNGVAINSTDSSDIGGAYRTNYVHC